MKRKLLIVTLLAVLSIMGLRTPTPAHACSCAGQTTAKRALEYSNAVFFGRVVSVVDANDTSYSPSAIQVTFSVLSSWKGVSTAQVTLRTG